MSSKTKLVSHGPAMVSLGRILDSTVLSLVVVLVSGLSLYCFGLFYALIVVTEAKRLGELHSF